MRWIAPLMLFCGRPLVLHARSSIRRTARATNFAAFASIRASPGESQRTSMEAKKPIVVVVGAGSKHDAGADGPDDLPPAARWGLGGALPLPFAERGFHVALMGRRDDVLREVAKSVQASFDAGGHSSSRVACVPCDVTDEGRVSAAFDEVEAGGRFGEGSYVDCVIFNVAGPFPPGFSFGDDCLPPHMLDTDEMARQHDVQVNGLIRVCRRVVPGMLERGRGCVLLSGATMQLRGGSKFGAIAPAKTALRSLGQSMFQCYGPRGIHVCNMNIDGVIDSPNTRRFVPEERLMDPYDIAGQYYNAYAQPPSVWSYEIMVSPGIAAPGVGMRM